jgi:hypothetical protein
MRSATMPPHLRPLLVLAYVFGLAHDAYHDQHVTPETPHGHPPVRIVLPTVRAVGSPGRGPLPPASPPPWWSLLWEDEEDDEEPWPSWLPPGLAFAALPSGTYSGT